MNGLGKKTLDLMYPKFVTSIVSLGPIINSVDVYILNKKGTRLRIFRNEVQNYARSQVLTGATVEGGGMMILFALPTFTPLEASGLFRTSL